MSDVLLFAFLWLMAYALIVAPLLDAATRRKAGR